MSLTQNRPPGTRHPAGTAPLAGTAKRADRRRQNTEGWLFIGPLVVGIIAFQLVPMVISVVASFTRWDGITAPTFAGLDNFARLLGGDQLFITVLRNTLVFTVFSVPLTVFVAFLLAMLVNRPLKGQALFRTAFFAPYVTNIVAIGLVWFYIYHPTEGILNVFLGNLGVEGPAWLSSSTWVLPAVILVSVWQGVGYPMVILLAGMQGIPKQLYEAAEVDGASPLRRAVSVTVPLLTPQLFFVFVTQFIASFQIFGLIYVMTGGGPGNSSSVYIYYLWQTGFQFGDLGYASAMAWMVFVLIAAVTWIQWKLQKKWVFYE